MEIEIKRTNKTPGPVPTPYYAPEPRIGPNMAARPTSPVPVDPAAALEGTAACFPASSKMRPFSKSNKKISMEMGKMIGERDAAVSEATELLSNVKRLRDAKQKVLTHMHILQKTVTAQSLHISELSSRLGDLQGKCHKLEVDNANLKRMISNPTTVSSRNIDLIQHENQENMTPRRREKGSLLALRRAMDMEKEVHGLGLAAEPAHFPPPRSRKVTPLLPAPGILVAPPPPPAPIPPEPKIAPEEMDMFSSIIEDALRTPPESRAVSRMASQCFSFKMEAQKIVESLSIQSGDIEDPTAFQISSLTLFNPEEKERNDSIIMADLQKALDKIADGEDRTPTPSPTKKASSSSQLPMDASKVKSLITTFTTTNTSPTKKPKLSALISYLNEDKPLYHGPGIQRERTAEQIKIEKDHIEKAKMASQGMEASNELFRLLDELNTTYVSK